jgi:hypothetical protein
MEDSGDEEHKCNASGSAAEASSSQTDVSHGSSVMQCRKMIDFKNVQVVKMSAAGVMLTRWPQVLDEVVKRVSQISMLASRFLHYYLTRLFEPPTEGGVRLIPPKSTFDLTFFEHIFKVVTGDATIVFEPTLQFVRCVWLHAMLVDAGATDLLPLNEAELWAEIQATEASKEAKKNARPDKPIKKRKKEDVDVECEEEDIHETIADVKQPAKKSKTGSSGQSASATSSSSSLSPSGPTNSIVQTILTHPFMVPLLPSCSRISQVLKFARKAYRTAFQQYQISGLKAHITWYLMTKYRMTKATAQTWLLNNFPDWCGSESEEEVEPKAKGDQPEQEEDRAAALAYLAAMDRQDLAQMDDAIVDELMHEQEASMMQDTAHLEWARDAQETEARKFSSLRGKRRNDLQIVELHHSILQALESSCCSSSSSQDSRSTSTTFTTKRFTLAPFTKFTRRFVRFDAETLQYLFQHPLFEGANKGISCASRIKSTSDIFNLKRLRSECKAGKGKTLSPSFTTDGVQVHLMWERIVSLPCRVDPKKEVA